MKIWKINNNSRGFTLIEVLVASFIFATVMAIAMGIFALSSNIQVSSEIARNILSDERVAIEQISHDLRMADEGYVFSNSNGEALASNSTSSNYILIKNKDKPDKLYGFIPLTKKLGVKEGNGAWQPLVSSEFDVLSDTDTGNFNKGVLFAGIVPSSSNTVQPFVNIEFIIDNSAYIGKASELVHQTIRTAVTTRAYAIVGQ